MFQSLLIRSGVGMAIAATGEYFTVGTAGTFLAFALEMLWTPATRALDAAAFPNETLTDV
jgi:hypothetical protein